MSAEIPSNSDRPEIPELAEVLNSEREGFIAIAGFISDQLDRLEEHWKDFATDPDSVNARATKLLLQDHLASINIAFDRLYAESGDDGPGAVTGYLIGLERRRTQFLNELPVTPEDEKYQIVVGGSPGEVQKRLEAYERGPLVAAKYLYERNIGLDLKKLETDAMRSNEYGGEIHNMPAIIRKERAKMIGEHCLDVLKVGIGVVGGILIAKKFGRFN